MYQYSIELISCVESLKGTMNNMNVSSHLCRIRGAPRPWSQYTIRTHSDWKDRYIEEKEEMVDTPCFPLMVYRHEIVVQWKKEAQSTPPNKSFIDSFDSLQLHDTQIQCKDRALFFIRFGRWRQSIKVLERSLEIECGLLAAGGVVEISLMCAQVGPEHPELPKNLELIH